MGIRNKILSGFLILACMLLIAGVWSIHELTAIGASVEKLLDENYKSINAARLMKEALEREDSAVLLLLSGNWAEGREIISGADKSFQEAFKTAQNNVTISGEQQYISKIESAYDAFKDLWAQPIAAAGRENNLNWYFNEAHPGFLKAKETVENLMALNQNVMYETATNLRERANRAVMPGVVAIVAALVFTMLFNYFVNHYMVSPIIRITSEIEKFQTTGHPPDIRVETQDEIQQLAAALNNLTRQSLR